MAKKYNFVYLTTNLSNGKQYIGDHSTDILNDNYTGSGLYIKRARKKYGSENLKRKILEYFESKDDAFLAQEKYINKYNTLTPNGYNISPTGGCGIGGNHSIETKIKLSKSHIGKLKGINLSENHKDKIRKASTGKNNGMYGKTHSKETRKKISNSNKGKNSWMKGKSHSKETLKKLKKPKSEEHKKKIRDKMMGNKYRVGKKHSEESKKKISEGNKGKKRTEAMKKIMSLNRSAEQNPMFGISVYDIWISRYGKKEADKRKKEMTQKSSISLTGLKRSPESIKKYREVAKNRIKKECPFCHKLFDPGNYKKSHGEKCKHNEISNRRI